MLGKGFRSHRSVVRFPGFKNLSSKCFEQIPPFLPGTQSLRLINFVQQLSKYDFLKGKENSGLFSGMLYFLSFLFLLPDLQKTTEQVFGIKK